VHITIQMQLSLYFS